MQAERTVQVERALREVQQAVEAVQAQLPLLVQAQLQEGLPRVQVHCRRTVEVPAWLVTLDVWACVA